MGGLFVLLIWVYSVLTEKSVMMSLHDYFNALKAHGTQWKHPWKETGNAGLMAEADSWNINFMI